MAALLAVTTLTGCGGNGGSGGVTGSTETATTDTSTTGTTSTTTVTTETTTTETTTTETETTDGGGPSTTNQIPLGAAFSGEIDFGSVAVGYTTSLPIKIYNGTSVTRTIRGLVLTGVSDFAIVRNGCPTGLALAPQDGCDVEIAFTPTVRGIRRARLDITVDPQTVGGSLLRGQGGRSIVPPPPPVTDTGTLTGP